MMLDEKRYDPFVSLSKLEGSIQTKKNWMVVAWIVEDGKIKMVNRITHQFPTNDFLAAVGQLANNCHEEKLRCDKAEKLATPLPSDPLPQAKVFKMPVVENTNSGLVAEPTTVDMDEETAGCKIRADALRNVDFYDPPLLDGEDEPVKELSLLPSCLEKILPSENIVEYDASALPTKVSENDENKSPEDEQR